MKRDMPIQDDNGRREHRRLEASFEVLFSTLDDEGRRNAVGSAQDVSLGGIRFSSNRHMSPGEEVEMEFRGDAFSHPFRTLGRVQHVQRRDGSFEVGIKFLSVADREALERCVAQMVRNQAD